MKLPWEIKPFGELYLDPSSNGITRPSAVRGSGYKMVNMGELYTYPRLKDPPMERVQLSESERRKFRLQSGDLLFARQSLVLEGAGKCCIVLDCEENTCFESHLIRVRLDPSKADPGFYYYFFKSGTGAGTMQTIVNQVAAAGIRGSDLTRLKVLAPSLKSQRKIAAVLSAYDELIENNRRRIALLEKLAEEFYREWFVRLRFPGHEKVKLVKGVPEGWVVKELGSFAKEIKRGIKKRDLTDDDKYVGLEHIPRRSMALREWATTATVDSDKLRFHERDILFCKIRPYLHKVALAHFSGVCSSDTIVIRPTKRVYEGFLFFTVFSETFVELASVASKGTKMPRADWGFLKKLELAFPSTALLEKFQLFFEPIFAEIVSLLTANEHLTKTRDLLLPRLISGKLSVEHLDIQFPPGMESDPSITNSHAKS